MFDKVTPSRRNPIYSVHIKTDEVANINVHNVVTGLTLADTKTQLAYKVNLTMMNVRDETGRLLEDYLSVMNRVFIYANDGETVDEVFRGYVWRKGYVNNNKKYVTLICYDNLIYFQKNEDNKYFPAGKSSDEICQSLCDDWGVQLVYDYDSIEHKKLPLSGTLSNLFTKDILDEVKRKNRKKYVMRSEKDVIYIKYAGSNSKIYEVKRGENAISSESELSMDEVITQVIITGKADEEKRVPIEETLTGNTDKYGILQKIVRKGSDEEEDNSHDDAQYYLDEYGNPKLTFETEAIDIPFIRKGDCVKVVAGDIDLIYLVLSITHDAINKTMKMTAERLDENEVKDNSSSSEEIYAGKEINLDYAPIYVSSDATSIAARLTGVYYLYDGIDFGGRYRITNSANSVGVKPINDNVTGWIDREYIV